MVACDLALHAGAADEKRKPEALAPTALVLALAARSACRGTGLGVNGVGPKDQTWQAS
jgi:hypothetical protein